MSAKIEINMDNKKLKLENHPALSKWWVQWSQPITLWKSNRNWKLPFVVTAAVVVLVVVLVAIPLRLFYDTPSLVFFRILFIYVKFYWIFCGVIAVIEFMCKKHTRTQATILINQTEFSVFVRVVQSYLCVNEFKSSSLVLSHTRSHKLMVQFGNWPNQKPCHTQYCIYLMCFFFHWQKLWHLTHTYIFNFCRRRVAWIVAIVYVTILFNFVSFHNRYSHSLASFM